MAKSKRSVIISIIYAILVLFFIGLNSFIKIHNFGDGKLYYSDAALRFHYAEMYSQGKKIPVIDKQVLYPEGLRVRTLIHLTMDWVIGNSYRLLFSKIPFTDYVKYFVSIFSSLSVLIVFLLGKTLWRRKESGLIAAVFYAIGIPSFWRITGNYLREEFTLPFIFLSLYLFLKANQEYDQVKKQPKIWQKNIFLFFAGASLALALISWHLTQFFFSLFALFLLIFFILNNSPVKIRLYKNLWLFIFLPLIAGIVWEPLQSKYFILSFPIIMSLWLWLITLILKEKLGNNILKRAVFAFGIIPFYFIAMRIFPKYFAEYGHVFETIIAKIIHFGRKPDNPAVLSFDARSIWMGPFASPGPLSVFFAMLVPLILGLFGWVGSFTRNFFKRFDFNTSYLSYFIIVFTMLYLLVIRLEVFLFFFVTIGIGGILNQVFKKKRLWKLFLAILLIGFFIESYKTLNYSKLFERYYLKLTKEWFSQPTAYGSDWQSLTSWVENNTKPGEAILADVDLSAMLLTYVNQPIIIEPIYENAMVRQRAQECINSFYQNEAEFLKIIKKFESGYVVYQQDLLLDNSKESNRYLTDNMLVKKNSVAYRMHFQPESLNHFGLCHQTNTFRVYKVLAANQTKPSLPKFPYAPYFDRLLFNQDPKSEFFDDAQTSRIDNLILKTLQRYNTALQLMMKNDFPNAVSHLKEVLKTFPDFERSYYYLGMCYQKLGEYETALGHFDKAISSFPNDLDAYLAKASILDLQNNLEEAVSTIITAIRLNPNRSDLYSTLGYFYIKRNLLDQGIDQFKTLASSLPKNSPLHLYTGYLYGYKNDLVKAEAEFNQALANDSTNPEVYEAFGSLYLQRKELEKAITSFEKSLKLNPNQPKIKSLLSDLRKRRF